jgi:curved DNA-binding protein CbpA
MVELRERGLLPEQASGGLDAGRVKAVYRELSLQFHPDRGGNTEAMKAINLFYERLTEKA